MRKYVWFLVIAVVTIVFLGVSPQYCFAQEDNDGLSFLVLPVAMYTSDTGFGGGFACLKTYHPQNDRISRISGIGIYTEKNQLNTQVKIDHYFSDNKNRMEAWVGYQRFPQYFYGMGNNTANEDPEKYTPETVDALIAWEYRMLGALRVRMSAFYNKRVTLESKTGGVIGTDMIPWGRGRTDAGPGFAILWDTRDNTLATKNGEFVKCRLLNSWYQSKGNGFSHLTVDSRMFRTVLPGYVVAFMLGYSDIGGGAPFYLRSTIGGYDRLRGYENERFTGRTSLLVQHDHRFPIWGPVEGSLFAASGQVADGPGSLGISRFHFAAGGGLRIVFNREDNFLVRLDYAKGHDSDGIYVTFGEAY